MDGVGVMETGKTLNQAHPELNNVIPDVAPELLGRDIEKALAIIDRILQSPDDRFRDRRFLLDSFYDYGLPILTPSFFRPWSRYMNASGFGALQVPTEAVDFLQLAAGLGIVSGVEIGSFRGGMSYFMAAVLQRAQKNFSLTLVDPYDSLIAFDRFAKKLRLKKVIPGTSHNIAGQAFDMVFIDGGHTYEEAMADFVNVGRHARKILGMHDIHDHGQQSGTVDAWNAMKNALVETHTIYEIAHPSERSLGIGAAVRF